MVFTNASERSKAGLKTTHLATSLPKQIRNEIHYHRTAIRLGSPLDPSCNLQLVSNNFSLDSELQSTEATQKCLPRMPEPASAED